jgi:hypothetical protein
VKSATYLLALALLAALGALWHTGSTLQAERVAHQATKTEHAQAITQAMTEHALEIAQRRKAEQELIDAEETHAQEIAALHLLRDRDRAAGAAVAVRLRDAARATATLAGEVCSDSASAQLREAAGAAAGMLAELRERADERAGILAQFATDAHLAGLACQRRYDEARQTLREALKN